MGKQIRFFMTYQDEKELVNNLRQSQDLILIYNNYGKENEKILNDLYPVGHNIYDSFLSLLRSSDLKDLIIKSHPTHNRFSVDTLNSKVIQFRRCKIIDSRLANGRFWFEENDELGKKDTDFIKWANVIFKWIKKNYTKSDDGYEYIGPNALALERKGKLQLGPDES